MLVLVGVTYIQFSYGGRVVQLYTYVYRSIDVLKIYPGEVLKKKMNLDCSGSIKQVP